MQVFAWIKEMEDRVEWAAYCLQMIADSKKCLQRMVNEMSGVGKKKTRYKWEKEQRKLAEKRKFMSEVKMDMINGIVVPSVLYGSETWEDGPVSHEMVWTHGEDEWREDGKANL